jgi:hypothetical protein
MTADPGVWCCKRDRQLEAIRHAIRLVSLGLLTEEQAAFVIQRDVALNGLSALYADKTLVELIGLRADQRLKLDEAKAEATANANKLMTLAFQTDPQSRKGVHDRNRRPEACERRGCQEDLHAGPNGKVESAYRQAIFASETPGCDAVCVIGRRGGGSPHLGSFTVLSRLGRSSKCRRSLGRSEDAFEGP